MGGYRQFRGEWVNVKKKKMLYVQQQRMKKVQILVISGCIF